MAIAFVQKCATTNDATPGTLTFGSNLTAGNAVLIMALFTDGLGNPTVADTQTNSYSLMHERDQRGFHCNFWLATGVLGAGCVVTLTLVGATFDSAVAYELSGVSTTGQPDATGGADGSSATLSCTCSAMSQNDGIVLAMGSSDNAKTPGSGFTETDELNAAAGTAYEYKVVSSGGSQVADMTQTSVSWGITAIVLKAAAAGGATFGDIRSHVRGLKRGIFTRLHGTKR